jgi:hypothetical protein
MISKIFFGNAEPQLGKDQIPPEAFLPKAVHYLTI